jgi:hypothetical protein
MLLATAGTLIDPKPDRLAEPEQPLPVLSLMHTSGDEPT